MNREDLTRVFKKEFRDAKDNWRASCPFHDDSTPSFYVHKEQYIAHCFGCDISGDIDKLAAEYLGLSIQEAQRALHLDPSEKVFHKLERSTQASAQQTDPVIPESWLAPFRKEAHKYVHKVRGFSLQSLSAVGSVYDQTLQRQVFPHRYGDGKLLGAVGRTCRNGPTDSKWHFYWKYDKGRALYQPFGINPLRPVLVVEGVFDLLWIYQQTGETNVVAPIGATATFSQLSQLKRLAAEIILGFDNDEAGSQGNLRVYGTIGKTHTCRFVNWPEHANDWMDLDGRQITEAIAGASNSVQRRLAMEARAEQDTQLSGGHFDPKA